MRNVFITELAEHCQWQFNRERGRVTATPEDLSQMLTTRDLGLFSCPNCFIYFVYHR